jgi:hypothetical protein
VSLDTDTELAGKILDLQGVKSFECWADIPPMDGVWLIAESPMSVLAWDGKRLGFALTRLGSRLEARIFLAGDTPERLDLETGKKLYVKPCSFSRLYRGDVCEKNFIGCQIKALMIDVEQTPDSGVVETGPYLEI